MLKLNKLEELYFGANKLREILGEIGDLKKLRLLDISNYELVHLPTSIKKLGMGYLENYIWVITNLLHYLLKLVT